jgi:hypothetical protein
LYQQISRSTIDGSFDMHMAVQKAKREKRREANLQLPPGLEREALADELMDESDDGDDAEIPVVWEAGASIFAPQAAAEIGALLPENVNSPDLCGVNSVWRTSDVQPRSS